MWDLHRPGLEPVSPALAGGFFFFFFAILFFYFFKLIYLLIFGYVGSLLLLTGFL